jgi:hypothetical protein
MDPILIREYRARWQAVAEVEQAEEQRATVEDRWRRLNAILRLAGALRLDRREQDQDEAVVWQRWAKLKAHLP